MENYMKYSASAIAVTWAAFGVIAERVVGTTIYISVPESSFISDINGEEYAGETLANGFKDFLCNSPGGNDLSIKYEIRNDDIWDETKQEIAILGFK